MGPWGGLAWGAPVRSRQGGLGRSPPVGGTNGPMCACVTIRLEEKATRLSIFLQLTLNTSHFFAEIIWYVHYVSPTLVMLVLPSSVLFFLN